MIHRPSSVTLVGAIVISWGILDTWGIVSTVRLITGEGGWSAMLSRDGLPFALSVARGAIELVAGFNILFGKDWARGLWTTWYMFNIILKFCLSTQAPLLIQGVQLLFIILLYLPDAEAFFETD